MKDYFSILQISPSAGAAEIKRAYRKLAHEYHPDKHHQDPHKTDLYEQIREAYLILTDPGKRSRYLEERWLLKAKGLHADTHLSTAPQLLKKAIELNRLISDMDPYRLKTEWIIQQFKQLLNPENQQVLKREQDQAITLTFFSLLLDTLVKLPYTLCESLAPIIRTIQPDDSFISIRLNALLLKKKRASKWQKSKGLLILLLTLLLCLLIGFNG